MAREKMDFRDSDSDGVKTDGSGVERVDLHDESADREDGGYPHEDLTAPRKTFVGFVFGVVKFFGCVYVLGVTSAIVAERFGYLDLNYSAEEEVQYVTQEQLLKVDMSVGDLAAELSSLGLDSRFAALRQEFSAEIGKSNSTLSNLDSKIVGFGRELDRFGLAVNDLDSKLAGLDYASLSDLAGVRKSLYALSGKVQNLEEVTSKPVATVEPTSQGSGDGELKEDAQKVATKKDVRSVLSGLVVEQFVNYSGRYLMVIGDGVSGSVHVSTGDRLGRYQVVDVKRDQAEVFDMLTGNTIYLVVAS